MSPARLAALGLLWFSAFTLAAQAHDAFTSSARLELRRDDLELRLTLARQTAAALVGSKTSISTADFAAAEPVFLARSPSLFEVSADGRRLAMTSATVTLPDESDVEYRLLYPRPPANMLEIRARFLEQLPPDHFSSISVTDQGRILASQELTHDAKDFQLVLAANGATAIRGSTPSFGAFLKLGVVHILAGYDHLLFLLGLLVVCKRLATMAGIVTCFTLAHSLTLALAALDKVAISSAIVEPLIALSIVFVGVENLLRKQEPRGRWALTLVFGLVHGFGFAGALQQSGLGKGDAIVMPLLAFNLGVELGQIAVSALALPLLFELGKLPAFARFGRLVISTAIALAGVYWLVDRVFLA